MARTQKQVCEAIVAATDEDRADLHRRVACMNLTPARKVEIQAFLMLLGMVAEMGAPRKRPN